ncbi:uncharacterized protein LOC127102734 [Lathyrus oleraceus]|uniref:uncharacterized protein LOC127102734 n=1 Tax=Pisum sativum TaxID=3888 RepID=UPI0021D07156|nr:uncharacterized protein LOC127102734 [Pisum sativum]
MALTEYDIQHVTQKAIKGSVLSDYLAQQPLKDYQSIRFEFLDEDIMLIRDCNIPGPEEGPKLGSRWTLVFDGASNAHGNGVGEVITSPTNFNLPFTARLCFEYTNNMAEYEACIFGIEVAIDLRIKILEVYGDTTLVISQVKGDWDTRDHKFIPYKVHVLKLVAYFDEITFHHIPREENQLADALATLASMFKVKWKNEAPSFHLNYLDGPAYCLAAEDEVDILQEDVNKFTSKISELELENTLLRLQLIKEKQRGDDLEDEGKEVKTLYESSKKRAREEKGKKEWVGGALLGANSELNGHNKELDRAWRVIQDLERTLK